MGLPCGMSSTPIAWAARIFLFLALATVLFVGVGMGLSCFNDGKYGCYDPNLWDAGKEEVLNVENTTTFINVPGRTYALEGLDGYKGVVGFQGSIDDETDGNNPLFTDEGSGVSEDLELTFLLTHKGLRWAEVDWSDAKDVRMNMAIGNQGNIVTYKFEFYTVKEGSTLAPRIAPWVVVLILLIIWVVAEKLLIKYDTKFGGGAEGQENQSKRKTRFF